MSQRKPQRAVTRMAGAGASASRIYDYLLGGQANTLHDRAIADQMLAKVPALRTLARDNRDFLRRAVRYLGTQGVTQFLDIGSGIPTVGNVHEIAEKAGPCRVMYVDVDAVTVKHWNLELSDKPNITAVRGDLSAPESILPAAREHLDFTQPIALLTVAVVHFVPDRDNPAESLAQYHSALPTGSYHVLTHATRDHCSDDIDTLLEILGKTRNPAFARPGADVRALMCDLEIVEPGLVDVALWRPDRLRAVDATPPCGLYGVMGCKA